MRAASISPHETHGGALPRAAGPAAPRLSLLNGFELRCDGAVVAVPLAGQRLIAFLALQQRPVQRGYVAGRLWLDVPERRAQASLRTTLWRAHVPGRQLLHATATHVRLEGGVTVDFRLALACAQRVLAGTVDEEALAILAHAGDLLPDWYDEWLLLERERFRQLRMLALEALCTGFSAAGHHRDAVIAGLAAVNAEPLRESAHRALIAAHLADGNACEAIREYRVFAGLLQRELGLEPSARMQTLAAELRAT
jgi:DNA-binding SARP family transcriptional activator